MRCFVESPHKCFVCGKSFTRKAILEKHEQSHSPREIRSVNKTSVRATFQCDICCKMYTRKQYLKDHIRIHDGVKNFQFNPKSKANQKSLCSLESVHKCSYCDKMFTRKEHLLNHTRLHTGGKLTISFLVSSEFIRITLICLDTPFQCKLCGKQFKVKKQLKAHIIGHSETPKTFVCYICSKSLTKQSSVTNHIKYGKTV